MFSASLNRNLCPGRVCVFVPDARSEGHRAYPQPACVMRVCSCNDQRQRKPDGVRQQAALYALFLSVRRGAALFFVPDSGDLVIQPSIDNQDQSMPPRCKPFSRSARRLLYCAIPGSVGVHNLMSISRWPSGRSTGNRSLGPRIWRPWQHGYQRVYGEYLADDWFYVQG